MTNVKNDHQGGLDSKYLDKDNWQKENQYLVWKDETPYWSLKMVYYLDVNNVTNYRFTIKWENFVNPEKQLSSFSQF